MKRLYLLLFAFLPLCLQAQVIPFIKADDLLRWKNTANDTVYVINFWATWCAPCVAELPAFEQLHREYAGKKVKVILVSNDFKKHVDTKVKPFLEKKQLQSEVVFMDEPTPNTWITRVNADWSGAIPATLIVAKGRGVELFFEKQLSYKQLRRAVRSALRKKVSITNT